MANGWDDFLRANGDPEFPGLGSVDPTLLFPRDPGSLPEFEAGLRAIVKLRDELVTSWMDEHGYDAIMFPANADVAPADADVNPESQDKAWANGVQLSNGNYALRHVGLPTVTVPMGIMSDIGMPVGLTFAGRAYDDVSLLSMATAFEAEGGSLRQPPQGM